MTARSSQRPRAVPAASVILPVYNAGKYLDAAIESILCQGFRDFELLLLNDGSTDGSPKRLRHYAALDSRCKVHSWPNKGLVATLNEGIQLARADVIIRMDADDICRPDRFEKQMAYLHAHPECVAVGSRVMLIDPEGKPIRPFAEYLVHEMIDTEHLSAKGGAITHPAVAMRREAVIGIGGYRVEFPHAEDIDLFLRLAEVGRLANLPELLLDYRQHPNSVGYKNASLQRDSANRAVAEARRRRGLPNPPVPASDRPWQVASLAEVHRKWGWWALSGRNLATARKHAFRAFTHNPFDLENLRLIACVLRGY